MRVFGCSPGYRWGGGEGIALHGWFCVHNTLCVAFWFSSSVDLCSGLLSLFSVLVLLKVLDAKA